MFCLNKSLLKQSFENMSELNPKCKCNLKYKVLSPIDINLFPQIKLVFIFTKFDASDVIFLTTTGEVHGFGSNKFGRLGLGHTTAVSEPTIIPELCGKDIINIEYGSQIMVALTESMDVYTCGYDYYGMLGNGQNAKNYRKPLKIYLNDKSILDVKCCTSSGYLLTESQEIYCFGYRSGVGTQTNIPTLVTSLENLRMISVSCGFDHTLALTDTGKVYAWGLNNSGQLGLNHNNHMTAPQLIQISDDIFVEQISCGNNHSLLLTIDGQIYSFGNNSSGQLGTGDTNNQITPKLVESKKKFKEIFAFEDISMALCEKNNVVIWGKAIVTTPFQTNVVSFQEAINTLTQNRFTYKPLSPKEVFDDKRVNRIMKTMVKAFNNPKSSDLKFKLKRKGSEEFDNIYVHKWFVEENCEYFERMFANNWSENESESNEISETLINEIQIKGYSYEAYYQYIGCLYTNCIETEDIELLIEMLSITDEYLDEEIKTKCVEHIKPLMNVQNVCSLYSSALRNRSQELEDYCFAFMTRNICSVTKTKDYQQMDSNYAKHFFTKSSQQK